MHRAWAPTYAYARVHIKSHILADRKRAAWAQNLMKSSTYTSTLIVRASAWVSAGERPRTESVQEPNEINEVREVSAARPNFYIL